MRRFLSHWLYIVVMTALTLYALFYDDLKIIFLPKSYDDISNIITIGVFSVFIVDILLSCLAMDKYTLSFFFWLDVVSTVSLVADITWIMDDVANFTAD